MAKMRERAREGMCAGLTEVEGLGVLGADLAASFVGVAEESPSELGVVHLLLPPPPPPFTSRGLPRPAPLQRRLPQHHLVHRLLRRRPPRGRRRRQACPREDAPPPGGGGGEQAVGEGAPPPPPLLVAVGVVRPAGRVHGGRPRHGWIGSGGAARDRARAVEEEGVCGWLGLSPLELLWVG